MGVVPTMGYLHEGHLTLMQRARRENDFVVATVSALASTSCGAADAACVAPLLRRGAGGGAGRRETLLMTAPPLALLGHPRCS